MSSELFAVGINHKGAPVELRERLAVDDDQLTGLLRALRERAGLPEAMIVSTCNRVEIYGVAPKAELARGVLEILASLRSLDPRHLQEHFFARAHVDAARHIFRVAASLESLVVGEPQILGQVKAAFSRAREDGAVGPVLDRCMSLAFKCAKRVRNETDVARGGASVPSVAVDLARSIFGDLAGTSVAVLGAGEMAEQAALHLQAAGAAEIVVVNRSRERGQGLAAKVEGRYEPWDRLEPQLRRVDIVIASTAAHDPVINRRMLKPVMRSRRHRPLFLVDIAVPRDVDVDVTRLDDVFLYNVDDLQGIVNDNLRSRRGEADKADALVEQEVATFGQWLRSRAIGPLMGQLQAHGRGVAEAELARVMPKLGTLTPAQQQLVEQLGRQIVQKLLHKPMANLRRASAEGVDGFDGVMLAEALAVLFELETGASTADEPEDEAAADVQESDPSASGARRTA
ncbi:glutamyl-tRNA reductase [Paraliomyxa miuraensis]|uniref:glutamyl-tRNA reductase n=1 Tax=Paraliomyxa miuraensis TaxID=376150 RepID=UPI0022511895|nr:glutamyl-tRNA reductase [Paraliomyxa miuraensis]MCX4245975.1 glutamyl-tRNA reductase [Paraliomyxa miuraensis]